MNYLQLCQELVALFGIAGGSGPDKVNGQSGELANVTRWIRDATLDIDNKWEDWRYLWLRYSGSIALNSSVASPPQQPGVSARRWATTALRYRTANPLGSSWTSIGYVSYPRFEQNYDPDTATPGAPQMYTVMPDNTLQFDRPVNQVFSLKGAFWRRPSILTQDADLPLLPSEYSRIIIVRALKYYADREDAPELVNAAVSEYPDLLEKLESSQLDALRHRRAAGSFEEQAGANVTESSWG